MSNIDWGFLITIVLALVIVGVLNRWLIKKTTVEGNPNSTPLVIPDPTTIAGYNDLHHAGAACIE